MSESLRKARHAIRGSRTTSGAESPRASSPTLESPLLPSHDAEGQQNGGGGGAPPPASAGGLPARRSGKDLWKSARLRTLAVGRTLHEVRRVKECNGLNVTMSLPHREEGVPPPGTCV